MLEWGSLPQLLSKLGEHGSSVKPQARIDSDDLSDPALKELFERFLQEGPRRVRELERLHGVKSFSALLTEMYSLVQSGDSALERIRNRYDAVLIDEFQDTDRIQYRIFKALFWPMCPRLPRASFLWAIPSRRSMPFAAQSSMSICKRETTSSKWAAKAKRRGFVRSRPTTVRRRHW